MEFIGKNIMDEEIFNNIVDIRRRIHMYPELNYKEVKTAAVISDELTRLGIEHDTGVGVTGIIGKITSGSGKGPVVALRADMDAIAIEEKTGLPFASKVPGVMHACGHDGHVAMLLGAAALLKDNLKNGTVLLVFQPAEEGGAGALKIIESGKLEGVDAIFGCHLDRHFKPGKLVLQKGPISAYTDKFEICIGGKGGHAAQPHDAVDAIVVASMLVISLQTIVSREANPAHPLIVSVGRIEGGAIHNAIAESASLLGTVRSTESQVREKVLNGIKRISNAIGSLHDAKITVKITNGYPPVTNTPEETLISQEAARSLLGDSAVIDSDYVNMGGEDFSYYQEKIPGCFARVGAQKEGLESIPAHSAFFDIDESALAVGAAYMASAARLTIERKLG